MIRRVSLALGLAVLLCGGLAFADTPDDLVLLHNGGMVRGTIIELVPDDKVVIQLPDGSSRTYPMTDVKFAGRKGDAPKSEKAEPKPEPEPEAPKPAPAPSPRDTKPEPSRQDRVKPIVTVRGQEAVLKLQGAGLTFHRKTGSAVVRTSNSGGIAVGYDVMCTAPCEVGMPEGTHTLALSKGGAPVEADPVTVTGDATLRGTYESRLGIRIAGFVLAITGPLVVTYGLIGDDEVSIPLTVLGAGMWIGGMVMVFQFDKATIEVVPNPGLSRPLQLRDQVASAMDSLNTQPLAARGLSIQARF